MRCFLAMLLCTAVLISTGLAQDPDAKKPLPQAEDEKLEIESVERLDVSKLPESSAIGKRLEIEVLYVTATGTGKQTAAGVLAMFRAGRHKTLGTVTLTAMDNQFASTQVSERVSVVTGFTPFAIGKLPVHVLTDTGVMLLVKPRLEKDGTATMQVYFERTVVSKSVEKDKPEAVVSAKTRTIVHVNPAEPILLASGPSEFSPTDMIYYLLSFREVKES
jgi:hypothetical protein